MTVFSSATARPGYDSLEAHEFRDEPEVLRAKVQLLASLLKKSKATCAYTGAGISTSSGIDDYATKVKDEDSRPKLSSPFDAKPTRAHRVMALMYNKGHL